MSVVLVVNSGSSSFKYQLIDMDAEAVLASGLVERIGEEVGDSKHTVHFAAAPAVAELAKGPSPPRREVPARAADPRPHGGLRGDARRVRRARPVARRSPPRSPSATASCTAEPASSSRPSITPLVEINIDELSVLAPLHNPANLQGIGAAKAAFPDVPARRRLRHRVPPDAPARGLHVRDRRASSPQAHRIRRYGFHGTSHKFVSEAAAAFLGTAARPSSSRSSSTSATAHRPPRSTAAARSTPRWASPRSRASSWAPARATSTPRCSSTCAPRGHVDRRPRRPAQQAQRAARARRRLGHARRRAPRANAGMPRPPSPSRSTCTASARTSAPTSPQLGGVDVISFTAGVGENAALVRAGALATLGLRRRRDRPRAQRGARARHPRHLDRRLARDRARRPHERGARDRPAGAASAAAEPRRIARAAASGIPARPSCDVIPAPPRADYAGRTARRRAGHPDTRIVRQEVLCPDACPI